jgi:hypothetical protein
MVFGFPSVIFLCLSLQGIADNLLSSLFHKTQAAVRR